PPPSAPPAPVSFTVRVLPAGAPVAGVPVQPALGPADYLSPLPSSPRPRADVDFPDAHAAAAGGGDAGGSPTWTRRLDPESLRAQLWNAPTAYRIPRVASAPARATAPGESISKVPEPRLDAQVHRRRAARTGSRGDVGGDKPLAVAGEAAGGSTR